MITGEESLQQIADTDQNLIPLFEKHGLGSYFKSENLTKVGRFMKLNTLLRSKKIDAKAFVELLNAAVASTSNQNESTSNGLSGLHFTSMLPCGLRNPFKEHFESAIQNYPDVFNDLNYMIEGNVNHELSYYPLLDTIEDINELPDVIMASDVNNFYHKPFMDKFIRKGIFSAYQPYTPNSYLEKEGYCDTYGNFTMFTSNMLVMAVDKEKLGDRKIPASWNDLLADEFEDDIIMRGEDNFFCNAVMLPFYKEHGFDAIKKLAQNIHSGLHPAEMVKLGGSGKAEGRAVYILPYFFSKRIKKSTVEVVWPTDGAIASPVFMLVKKGTEQKNKPLLDLLTGKEMGEMLKDRHFPSLHPDVVHDTFPESLSWLGWDFLYQNDIGKLKEEIREVFMEIWNKKELAI